MQPLECITKICQLVSVTRHAAMKSIIRQTLQHDMGC